MKKVAILLCLVCASASLVFAQSREFTGMDGQKIIVNEEAGTVEMIYPDGTRKTWQLNGMTPYGQTIAGEKKAIQMQPVPVTLVYDPVRSDEILDGDAKKMFEELFSVLRRRVGQKRFQGVEALEVRVSWCNFCRRGLCAARSRGYYVEFVMNNEAKETLVFDPVFLKDLEKRRAFQNEVLEKLSLLEQ